MADTYIETEDVLLYLANQPGAGAPTLNENDKNFIEKAIPRAQDMVDAELRLSFAEYGEASDVIVYGKGLPSLALPAHLQGSVTRVLAELGTGYTNQIVGWVEQADGSLYLTGYNAYAGYGWPQGARYTVTATWGYGPVPEAVKEVCIEIVVNIWRGRDKGMWQDAVGSMGASYSRFTGGLPKAQRDILANIRRRYKPPRMA